MHSGQHHVQHAVCVCVATFFIDTKQITVLTLHSRPRYKGTKIQLLDLPGIIEGAAHGKGRGRQVVACAKSADMVMMVLDAGKEAGNKHREILERELEIVGIRLNKRPPNIAYVKKDTGGVKFNATVPLTKLGADPAKVIPSLSTMPRASRSPDRACVPRLPTLPFPYRLCTAFCTSTRSTMPMSCSGATTTATS